MAKMGESGERDVARRKIEEISLKYGINKPLWENKKVVTDRTFSCRSAEYRDLMSHCIFDTNKDAKVFENGGVKFGLIADITDLEFIEVMEKMEHYWKAYVVERTTLLKAFIIKHKIGTVEVAECDAKAISKEEYGNIKHMASVISEKPYKAKTHKKK